MSEMLFDFINQYGYFAIFALIFLENVFPPIPSMVLLPFAGILTFSTSLNFWGIVFYSTLGSMFGAVVLYYIGYHLPIVKIEKLFDSRFGHILGLSKNSLHKAVTWFSKYGNKATFFGRFIPIIRSVISIPAGITKMKSGLFLFLSLISCFIWNTFFVYLGVILKENSLLIISIVSKYLLIFVVLIFIVFVVWFCYKKRK